MSDQLQKYSDLRIEKGYAFLRWLMLISTGAFSLSVTVLFGQHFASCSLPVLKAALTANAGGVLLGAIALYGEAMLPQGAVRFLVDKEILKLQGNHAAAANVPDVYVLPWYMKRIEQLCYFSLCASLCFWVYFVWLQ